jgi:hypothetical protein
LEVLRTGGVGLYDVAHAHTRVPAGHPEGYLEGFANLYRNVAFCIQAGWRGQAPDPVYADFPTVDDGVRGMEFIYHVIASGQSDQKWVPFVTEK